MSPKEYHLIEKYLNNDLTDVELREFEAKMSSDQDFATTVQVYTEVSSSLQTKVKRAKSEKELKETLSSISGEFFEDDQTKNKVISLKTFYLAAACVILALSFFFIINWQSEPAYSDYAQYEPLALANRSVDQKLTVSAEEAFNTGNYAEAAILLEQILQSTPDNPAIKLYLALSYIETENYQSAQNLLNDISEGTSIYKHTADWYLALSYLKQGNEAACKQQLEKIPVNSPKYDEAKELLKAL